MKLELNKKNKLNSLGNILHNKNFPPKLTKSGL